MRAWPDWPYSLLLLTGPKGCGKTHLAHVFAAQSRASFIDAASVGILTAEQLLGGAQHSWVLDDIEKVKSEASLAQLINHARSRGDYLLMTARARAPMLPFGLPDLTSRLKALPELSLGAPDDALLKSVLAKAFADRQLRIAPPVLDYALTRLERSYESAARFAAAVDAHALAQGRAATLPLVRQLLESGETDGQASTRL
ncbi:MAG: AAA family ATPase [Alphaproteobacteria bacterium]